MKQPRFIAWRSSDRRFILVVVLLVAILTALITPLYLVYNVRRIDGASMEPALLEGDRILLTRGYDDPHAGDIVSFTAVDQSGQEVRLIKRVVAIPGDSVEVLGDSVYVNGELSIVAPTARVGADSYRLGPMTVPEGSVYVVGDNRPVSLDSRHLGFVPLTSIAGKAVAVILPLSHIRGIDE